MCGAGALETDAYKAAQSAGFNAWRPRAHLSSALVETKSAAAKTGCGFAVLTWLSLSIAGCRVRWSDVLKTAQAGFR